MPQEWFAFPTYLCYPFPMNDSDWNSIPLQAEETPRVSIDDLRAMIQDIDPEEYDLPVQEFLDEIEKSGDMTTLGRAATLLLQDEIDFSPELAAMGVEPDEDLISLFIAAGADVNAVNPHGQTPLHIAAQYNYAGIVDMLLTAGAKPTVPNRKGIYASELATDPELAARLQPFAGLADGPLPPEIEDADFIPGEEGCSCGDPDCSCHHEHPGHECTCGQDHTHECCCEHEHHHHHGSDCSCGHHHPHP